jgi:hypothetical protein
MKIIHRRQTGILETCLSAVVRDDVGFGEKTSWAALDRFDAKWSSENHV